MPTAMTYNVIPQLLVAVVEQDKIARADCATRLAQTASNMAPVSNVEFEPDGKTEHEHLYQTFEAIENEASSGKKYGPWVHYGTVKQGAQPFWWWAIDQNRMEDSERMSQVIKDALAVLGVV